MDVSNSAPKQLSKENLVKYVEKKIKKAVIEAYPCFSQEIEGSSEVKDIEVIYNCVLKLFVEIYKLAKENKQRKSLKEINIKIWNRKEDHAYRIIDALTDCFIAYGFCGGGFVTEDLFYSEQGGEIRSCESEADNEQMETFIMSLGWKQDYLFNLPLPTVEDGLIFPG